MAKLIAALGLLATLAGCGPGSDSEELPNPWAGGGGGLGDGAGQSGGQADLSGQGEDGGQVAADGPPAELAEANTPPAFGKLPPQTLAMGHQTIIDLNPFLADAEDGASGLALSWSADHVALLDPGDHRLQVVAPVDWSGAEVIELVATDSGGLTASALLKVIVEEVVVPDPPKPGQCGETLFSHAAGTEVTEVLVSGSFNDWADQSPPAGKLLDPEGDGTWEVVVVLEPGKHHYKFIVDGKWIHDPANPNKVADGYDGFNSVLEVPPCDE